MQKLKEMILMLCFILSGALCYASGAAGMGNGKGEGIPIEIKDSMGSLSGSEKGETINATLEDHVLTVVSVKTSVEYRLRLSRFQVHPCNVFRCLLQMVCSFTFLLKGITSLLLFSPTEMSTMVNSQ